MKWFRFYSEVLHDPKVQTLKPELFQVWVNLLCLANENRERGVLPPVEQIAFALRIKVPYARKSLDALISCGLLDRDPEGVLAPHNWEDRQSAEASSTSRVRRYRERIRANGESITGYTRFKDQVMARDGGACVYCLATHKLVLDHLVPVQRGGDGQPDNLVVACKSCNSGKAGRLVEETGYVFRRPESAAQYRAVKARLGIAPSPLQDTVTGGVPVTVPHGACHSTELELELDREETRPSGVCDAPARAREGPAVRTPEDAEHLRRAEALLSSDLRTEHLALELGRQANTAGLLPVPGWRFLRAAERMTGGTLPAGKLRWPYFVGIVKALTEAEREAAPSAPAPADVNGHAAASRETAAQARQRRLSDGIKASAARIAAMEDLP